ncbi:MAG: ATP-dependent Clp protease ATP-binding subunit [Archangiaceae bacterium]|nr:ATP-dependent Clp protease ATP-binding subunit [Archangiaceae bacterium]
MRTLRQIGRNLSHQARDGALGRARGREAIVNAVVEALEKRSGAGIVLVGAGGVGKTAIVHEVTRRLVERTVTTRRDVWRIDGNQFIAGMSYVGQWEARARELCNELVDTGDVLFVDDLTSLVFAGRHAKGDTHLAMYLEPQLARRELTIVGECTPERFERLREEAPSFAALFDVVQVPPMSERETLPVLLAAVRELEQQSAGVTPRLAPDVMQLALELSGRFFAGRALPGRAVRLVQQVLSGAGTVEGRVRRYRAKDVFEAVRRETGLPDFVLGGATPKSRAEISADLSAQVAGQPEAIEAVTDAVLSLQLSVQDPEKPLANYLFVGPTGVGKTETAKALARTLFGSSERLVRFDMSELADPGSIDRLIGAAGGAQGELITALRTQPFCVVLFDEIEKAHPRVFDALLQFLGEGRLSDSTGRTADGRNCVVVMTSNLGVREAATQTGFARGDVQAASQHYLSAAKAFFRPELFNRLDRVVPFRSLDKPALRLVVEHALGSLLRRRGLQRGNVLVDVEPELLELLVDQAFDPRYGARPLKRALERQLAVPLAHHLVRRDVDELALIEMLRRGDEAALSVKLLAPPPAVPVDAPTEWTLPRLRATGRRLTDELTGLLGSPAARALRVARREALDAGLQVPSRALVLAELEQLSTEVEELVEGPLDPEVYEERVDAPRQIESRGWRTPKRNRPTVEVSGVMYTVNEEAAVGSSAPKLAGILDELEVLKVQLAESAREETVTLLLDVVGTPAPGALATFAQTLPLLPVLQLFEGLDGWHAGTPPQPRRHALVFQGAGVRTLLSPWFGYGRVDVQADDGVVRRALVRALPLEGESDGSEAATRARLTSWETELAAEREARRRGAQVSADRFPLLVLERAWKSDGVFRATGLRLSEKRRHLAACLRAKGRA